MSGINTRVITTSPMGQAVDVSLKEMIDGSPAAVIAELDLGDLATKDQADLNLGSLATKSSVAATDLAGGFAKHALIAGAAAGNVTVTGIKAGDELNEVLWFGYTDGALTDVNDLTGEFTISATNTINNADGTTTAGGKLLVRWTKKTA